MKYFILIIILMTVSCATPKKKYSDLAIEDFQKRKVVNKTPSQNIPSNEDCFERYDGKIKCIPHDDVVRATKLKGEALKEFIDSVLLPETKPTK